jgi:nucleoside-diphosphate-sugar epimerase
MTDIDCDSTVLPGVLWGSTLSPEQSQSTSMNILNSIFHGDAPATTWFPAQHFTNVRDSALLHVAALLLPDVRSRRLFSATAPYNINEILGSLRSLYPSRKFPGDVKTHDVDGAIFDERADAESLLRRMGKEDGWTGLDETIQECCDAWIARAKQMPEMKMKIIRE